MSSTHPTAKRRAIRLGMAACLLGLTAFGGVGLPNPPLLGLKAEAVAPIGAARSLARPALSFEANVGQASPEIAFLSRGAGYGIFLRKDGIALALARGGESALLELELIEARWPAAPAAPDPPSGRAHYFKGNDPKRWQTNVPVYRRIAYDGVYPGIDLVVYGNQHRLEYDFVVAPGNDPGPIALRFSGAEQVALGPHGALEIATSAGVVSQYAPYAYQEIDGEHREVPSAYRLDDGRVGFQIGSYDPSHPLVIDPLLDWSGFLGGGTGYEWGNGMEVAADGTIYASGYTYSSDFPGTTGGFQGGSGCAPGQDPGAFPLPGTEETCKSDAFVSRISADGATVLASAYFGGSESDRGMAMDLGPDGSVYLSGGTNSPDLPIWPSPGAADEITAGSVVDFGFGLQVLAEAFAARLSGDLSTLIYSTYLGGGDADESWGIDVDVEGRALVTGHTLSDDMPGVTNSSKGDLDAFAVRLSPFGDAIDWALYVGGSGGEFVLGSTVDESGAVYLVGETGSTDLATPGVFGDEIHDAPDCADVSFGPLPNCLDAFLAKVDPTGALAWATYVGGSGHEHAFDVAVHNGEAHLIGHSFSDDIDTVGGVHHHTSAMTNENAWVARISANADQLYWVTVLGGDGWDFGQAIEVDSAGNVYAVGLTASTGFPVTPGAAQPEISIPTNCNRPDLTCIDGFLTVLAPDGVTLLYSTYFGGDGPDVIDSIALAEGAIYVGGVTFSPDYPVTAGAFQETFAGPGGYSDSFVTVFANEGRRLFDEETFGGNGRTCVTCHSVHSGTISPEDVQERIAADPSDALFLHDGLDDGFSGTTRITEHATIRVPIELPTEPDSFITVTILEDPGAEEVILLRGVPSTINTPALDPSLMYDLRAPTLQCQALGAIDGHALATVEPTAFELDQIAAFQQNDPRFFSSQEIRDYATQCGPPVGAVSGCPDPAPGKNGDTTNGCAPEPELPVAGPNGRPLTLSEQRGRAMFDDVPIEPIVPGEPRPEGRTQGICAVCHSGPMLNQGNGLNNHLADGEGNIPPPTAARTATAGVSERNLLDNPKLTFVVHRGNEDPVHVVSPDPGMLLRPEINMPNNPAFEANFFKIPQLWGVAGTAPYFHDNSARDLWEVAEHYSWFYENIRPFDQHFPDGLTEQDEKDMVAFMLLLPEPGRGFQLLAGLLGLLGLHGLRRGRAWPRAAFARVGWRALSRPSGPRRVE